MYPSGNQNNLQNMLVIGMVVLIIVIATSLSVGGHVYWWQKKVAEKEMIEYQRRINILQNELAFLRDDLGKALLQKSKSGNAQTPVNDKIYVDTLSGIERQAIDALKNRAATQWAALVDPEKGLRFSPFSYVDSRNDLIFKPEQIKNFFKDAKVYTWGYSDQNGLPIRMTPGEYFDNYVFDCDYSTADEINYNATLDRGLTFGNIFEVYPRAIIVEFGKEFSASEEQGSDWRSIRLVFEKNENGKWYLVGIVHDRWKL